MRARQQVATAHQFQIWLLNKCRRVPQFQTSFLNKFRRVPQTAFQTFLTKFRRVPQSTTVFLNKFRRVPQPPLTWHRFNEGSPPPPQPSRTWHGFASQVGTKARPT